MRALAADDRDPRLVDLVKIQHVLLSHGDTSEAPVFRFPAPADRIAGVSHSAEPLVEHVLIPACLPSDEP
ncbi:hypothetical protein Sviol_03580 [Streptomyces violascens]|uniref:Uncharacterized protein n=1 Tax=Streptomyces violascens TaxID=67381 RepID=A0ABQ3QFA0_9ACTN|nr:hypothetical protein Sviol_03580 [Streptomyces violascens]